MRIVLFIESWPSADGPVLAPLDVGEATAGAWSAHSPQVNIDTLLSVTGEHAAPMRWLGRAVTLAGRTRFWSTAPSFWLPRADNTGGNRMHSRLRCWGSPLTTGTAKHQGPLRNEWWSRLATRLPRGIPRTCG